MFTVVIFFDKEALNVSHWRDRASYFFILCVPLFIATLCTRKRAKYEEELSDRPARLGVQTGKDALLQDLSRDKQERRQGLHPAELPRLLHFGLSSAVSTSRPHPQLLAVSPYLFPPAKQQRELRHHGSNATNMHCKYFYLIHLNNLALPGAVQTLP